MTPWEVDIHPAPGRRDAHGLGLLADAADLGLTEPFQLRSARGFLLEGDLSAEAVTRLARELLADPVVETFVAGPLDALALVAPPADFAPERRLSPQGDAALGDTASGGAAGGDVVLVHVLPKPGVMDPVAQSTLRACAQRGLPVAAARTLRKYWIRGLSGEALRRLCKKLLANDSIEETVFGPLGLKALGLGQPYRLRKITVPLRDLDDAALARLSRQGQLYLSLPEMQTIREHYRGLGREPTDVELETIAQTWSEHCSHKTLAGRVRYRDERGERQFNNLLKETIFAATQTIRARLGADDWCVSVFEDNAGVVRFDHDYNVVFKVETHNHPSAIEPYGGANTGLGGVIRDPLGTGLGAKPVCNTNVFCFAPPDTAPDQLPPGVLHPRRVMKGVVAGVRDYGNRMGIPTVNGAIYFDPRYVGNPLVYCGNVGLLPRDKSFKQARAGDWIVAVGGRTGRDGIHGATFSSAELTSDSEHVSGGAVQIGDAVTEKMLLDVLLQARDRGLYTAITDCGAGGFSSAVGEMGAELGAEARLEGAPLKYAGLSYTEIWISEAQERMVLAVPPANWPELAALCASEGVEAAILGEFTNTGRLVLKYEGEVVGDLAMRFLHEGRPPVTRQAEYAPAPPVEFQLAPGAADDLNAALLKILGSLNVASKEWVIRQYDHEVQGGSVIKPLVGAAGDGPGDAAVVRPRLDSWRGLVVACGMNPRYGDLDTADMAASAIDEALRNCVAVGADPARIAILDNFCWGYTDRPETLGSLVRAALACHDVAVALGTPFISGKDSLNNEYRYHDEAGRACCVAIPPTLLISALGQVVDARRCVTMDLKESGNALYAVGLTRHELGGSHWNLVGGGAGGRAPRVDAALAKQVFAAVHRAIQAGCVRSCHDLSEGGLAVALAEMAFAGGLGVEAALPDMPRAPSSVDDDPDALAVSLLFSESNTRFVCEVEPTRAAEFERLLASVPHARVGEVTSEPRLRVAALDGARRGPWVLDCEVAALKRAWQAPLRFS